MSRIPRSAARPGGKQAALRRGYGKRNFALTAGATVVWTESGAFQSR
ncbi:MAG: hypothetical protein R2729_12955 [Bryobacteraceae bacterium]